MSVISGILGAKAQKSAASSAASAATQQAAIAAQTQKEMLDKVLALQQPYTNLGYSAIPKFTGVKGWEGVSPSAGLPEAMTALKDYPELSLPQLSLPELSLPQLTDLPTLNLPSFSAEFNPNDPTYLARKKELEDTINAASAARGNYNSRPTINALYEGNIDLTADEAVNQFNRALSTYGANIDTSLANYGAGYQRASDLYNAAYGRAADLYGADTSRALNLYGAGTERATNLYNTGYGKLTDLYNLTGNISALDYQKVLDALKIGTGAAGTAGQSTMATGQGLANTYGQLGTNLMNTNLASGQAMSDLWGGIGQTTGTIGSLALLKKFGLLGA